VCMSVCAVCEGRCVPGVCCLCEKAALLELDN
jgi:hypothetical protein